jgi:hypothetical protein
VKALNECSVPSTLKVSCAPSERPTQLRCMSLMLSGQSKSSKSSIKRSAYAVILSIHCFIGRRSTGCPPRSDLPSMTSSFARTVPKAGHQFTATSSTYAKPFL